MKTPDEIEKLATAKYGRDIYSIDEVEAYKEGYAQCQKDNDVLKSFYEDTCEQYITREEPNELTVQMILDAMKNLLNKQA